MEVHVSFNQQVCYGVCFHVIFQVACCGEVSTQKQYNYGTYYLHTLFRYGRCVRGCRIILYRKVTSSSVYSKQNSLMISVQVKVNGKLNYLVQISKTRLTGKDSLWKKKIVFTIYHTKQCQKWPVRFTGKFDMSEASNYKLMKTVHRKDWRTALSYMNYQILGYS